MVKRIIYLILVFSLSSLVFADNSVEVDSYKLNWTVEEEHILFTLSAETEGWIAVGFNPTRIMKDADIKMGFVTSSGEVVMEDHYGNNLFTHRKDSLLGGEENLEVISGSETEGITTLTFRMPLNSGDHRDQVLTPGEEVKLIFALGQSDNFRVKHTDAASVEITLSHNSDGTHLETLP